MYLQNSKPEKRKADLQKGYGLKEAFVHKEGKKRCICWQTPWVLFINVTYARKHRGILESLPRFLSFSHPHWEELGSE